MELETYIQYHETTLHEKPGFAYNTYLCTIPLDFSHVDLHWHEQMELIYVKKGCGSVTVGTGSYPVSAGTIVPVLPGQLHAIFPAPEKSASMEYENIIFSLSVLDNGEENDWCRSHVLLPLQSGSLRCPCPIYPGTPLHDAAAAALDEADRICDKKQEGYSLLVKSCLFRFLFALYSARMEDSAGPAASHEQVLKEVIRFVREHFSEPITIADAAAVTGYSEAHFMRLFRRETGRTFNTYLTDYRLGYACYLLRESQISVSEVAARCGFDNFSYFIRLFRRRYGTTPGKFRR